MRQHRGWPGRVFKSGGLNRRLRFIYFLFAAIALLQPSALAQEQEKDTSMNYPTLYRTIQIDGLSIFYREAGPKNAPTILLLHGLPSSSRMFEPLFTRLSD